MTRTVAPVSQKPGHGGGFRKVLVSGVIRNVAGAQIPDRGQKTVSVPPGPCSSTDPPRTEAQSRPPNSSRQPGGRRLSAWSNGTPGTQQPYRVRPMHGPR